MDGGAWEAAVHEVAKSRTRLSDFMHFHFHALEKEMATHSSVHTWRIPGTAEPGGLPSMGLHRVWHDWTDLAAAAARLPGQISIVPGLQASFQGETAAVPPFSACRSVFEKVQTPLRGSAAENVGNVTESKLSLLAIHRPVNREKMLRQGIRLLLWKPTDREDGRLKSQNNHLAVRLDVRFLYRIERG